MKVKTYNYASREGVTSAQLGVGWYPHSPGEPTFIETDLKALIIYPQHVALYVRGKDPAFWGANETQTV